MAPSSAPASPPSEDQLDRLEKSLESDPKNPGLLVQAIDTALAIGDIAAARKHANTALDANPGDPFMRHRHANVLVAEGRLDEAAVIFAYLLAKHGDANIAYNLGLVRFRQGNYDAALKAVTPFTPATQPRSVALAVRALHYQGKPKEALELAGKAPHSDDAEVLAALCLVYLDEDDLAKAEELAKQSLQGGRRELEALVVSGTAALSRKDAKSAQAQFKEALEINPNDPRTLSGRGRAYLLVGDAPNARKYLERARAQLPDNLDTIEALAWAHAMAGELSQAEEMFKQLLAKGDKEARRGLAVTYALQGRNEDAQMSLAHLKPDDDAAQAARAVMEGGTKAAGKLGQLARTRLGRARQPL